MIFFPVILNKSQREREPKINELLKCKAVVFPIIHQRARLSHGMSRISEQIPERIDHHAENEDIKT
jgi:hypothetical protein